MKKSFLKRAMAAAIAVPVALTQTLLCASFAADTTEDTATDTTELLGTLSVDTFVGVAANPTSNAPVFVSESGTTRTYEQTSVWNQAVYGVLNSIPAGTVEAMDVAALAEKVEGDSWYMEALKNAMLSEGASAAAQVNADNVVITIAAKYAYAADVQAMLDAKLGDLTVDLGNPTSDIKVVVTVDTADLNNSTTVKAAAEITVDGDAMDVDGLKAYAQSKMDEIRTATADAAQYDAELAADVAALFDGYQAKLDRADNILTTNKADSYEGAADYNTLLALAKEKYEGNAVVDKLPATIGEALNNGTIVGLATEALNQIGGITAKYGYGVEIAPEEVVTAVEAMYDVDAEYTLAGGVLYAATSASAPDVEVEVGSDAYAALEAYFSDLEAANGYDYVEGSLATSKSLAASVNADVAAFDGDVTLDVTRVLTYEVVDPEETTTTSDTDDSGVDGTTTSDTDDSGVDGTTTSDTDDSGVDGTTTSDTDDSGIDGTTTSDTDDSGIDGTTTSDTDDSGIDGTTTSDTDDSGIDGTTTTTVDSGVVDPGSSSESETSTESGESTTTTESEPTVVVEKAVSAVAKTDNFYFSHDDSELTAEMLLESAQLVVTTDGVAADPVDVLANIQLGTTQDAPSAVTPADLYAQAGAAYAALPVYAFYVDPDDAEAAPVLLETEINVYVGVKGDVTLTGEADAIDAAAVLVFAASVGAGNADAKIYSADDATLENFAFFLGDTETEDKTHVNDNLNAMDAAAILRFAAMEGALTEEPTIAQIKEFWEIILATATV